ncbi:hypothetical protein VCR5J5_1370137 [Vibrio crassostreae]|uniref:Uncharacterized protein n=1 Tax=Vibrio crassostreae TaxID=246167 RepID=A0A822MT88_9VIBR|nr:hypothetical protein VCR5J5_1370137 [Vibrio crassostreae]CDT52626.1 hypothetical protein VCR9J2_720382 [Vibrio crassostreae]
MTAKRTSQTHWMAMEYAEQIQASRTEAIQGTKLILVRWSYQYVSGLEYSLKSAIHLIVI